jgi:hypothetical protein
MFGGSGCEDGDNVLMHASGPSSQDHVTILFVADMHGALLGLSGAVPLDGFGGARLHDLFVMTDGPQLHMQSERVKTFRRERAEREAEAVKRFTQVQAAIVTPASEDGCFEQLVGQDLFLMRIARLRPGAAAQLLFPTDDGAGAYSPNHRGQEGLSAWRLRRLMPADTPPGLSLVDASSLGGSGGSGSGSGGSGGGSSSSSSSSSSGGGGGGDTHSRRVLRYGQLHYRVSNTKGYNPSDAELSDIFLSTPQASLIAKFSSPRLGSVIDGQDDGACPSCQANEEWLASVGAHVARRLANGAATASWAGVLNEGTARQMNAERVRRAEVRARVPVRKEEGEGGGRKEEGRKEGV